MNLLSFYIKGRETEEESEIDIVLVSASFLPKCPELPGSGPGRNEEPET